MFGIILFWLACAILSAVAAGNKGRSGFGWFVLGFLFGPFGFILSLVVSDKSAPNFTRPTSIQSYKPTDKGYTPVTASEMAKCPFCAEDVQAAAIKCKHCGEAIEARPDSRKTLKIYKGYPIGKEASGCSVDDRSFVTLYDAERWIDGNT